MIDSGSLYNQLPLCKKNWPQKLQTNLKKRRGTVRGGGVESTPSWLAKLKKPVSDRVKLKKWSQ